MNGLIQDIRYSLRQLRKNRGFATIAVLTLALGIGANTAVFSVVNGVLLNPLPFPNASRIVSMFQEKPDFPFGSISYPNFLDWQRENRSFEAIAAYRWADGGLTGNGPGESVHAQHVSATFFPILGVTPILGRNFTADEDRRGANPTALISEGLWKRKFASDPNIVGKRIVVAGEGRTIVGVIPSSFHLEIQNFRTSEIYEPIGEEIDPLFHDRASFWGTDAIALLKPGVSIEQAREDMKRVNAELAAAYPDVNANIKSNIMTLKDQVTGDSRPVLLLLLGAVGFVLLISCVNVANLLLARSTARQREFSIRVALGARQARVIRQLLTESILLAIIGGALGVGIAKWGVTLAVTAAPNGTFMPTIPRAEEIGVDFRVLLFAIFASLLTGILFGLIPALKTSGIGVAQNLKDAARSISGHRSRLQGALVIGEMAMALVLLVGAGLMLRTLMQLWSVKPGFDPHNVISLNITPPPLLAKQSPDAIRAYFRDMVSTIRSVPGVESASLSWGARPMEGDNEKPFTVEGPQPPARQADAPLTLEYWVQPEYLNTMHLQLLRGRFLSENDNEHSERVVVIDSGLAAQYFPGQDPIGKHVSIFDFGSDPNQRIWAPFTVVGVVGHVKQFGLSRDVSERLQAQIYRAVMQGGDVTMKSAAQGADAFVKFQSPLSADAAFENIRKKLSANNDQLILSGNESEEEVVARSIASQRFSLTLLGGFAGLALLLAGIGIYGVLSYLVGQRTQEIGVRMALGARRFDVLRMVLKDGARMTLVGAGIGVLAALAMTQFMASMLFGVTPTDPLTFALVAVLLCCIALISCYVPARRAMRVDPMVALRYE
ncbi:MAG TPA: ABC transporter permease [Candidatus Sulfotelmatobacter sp.]|nr:ABC transporter permease [Candidatus Sulfotelmatobacter sp.]